MNLYTANLMVVDRMHDRDRASRRTGWLPSRGRRGRARHETGWRESIGRAAAWFRVMRRGTAA